MRNPIGHRRVQSLSGLTKWPLLLKMTKLLSSKRTLIAFLGLVIATVSPSSASSRRTHLLQIHVYARTFQARLQNDSGAKQPEHRVYSGSNSFVILTPVYAIDQYVRIAASYQYTTVNGFSSQRSLWNVLETYADYTNRETQVRIGNQMFVSPWAYSHLALGMAPSAYQGISASSLRDGWHFETALMDRFNQPGGTAFTQTTLLTNLSPGARTGGFLYAHAGYSAPNGGLRGDAYGYRIAGLGNLLWLAATTPLSNKTWHPLLDAQLGFQDSFPGAYSGKIRSEVTGAQFSVTPTPSVKAYVGFDFIPWHAETRVLPTGTTCDSTGPYPTFTLSAPAARDLYFVPTGAAQCQTRGKNTTIYFGGFAAPFSDGYAWDPLFTTGAAEGQPDRHSPGSSDIVGLTFFDRYGHFRIDTNLDSFNYSNAIAPEKTTEFDTITRVYSRNGHTAPYRGAILTIFFVQLRKSNTVYSSGSEFLGGSAKTQYMRLQIEFIQ